MKESIEGERMWSGKTLVGGCVGFSSIVGIKEEDEEGVKKMGSKW